MTENDSEIMICPQPRVPIANLGLDPKNPRLPERIQGGSQEELLRALKQTHLDELAESIAQNGYFAEEPLICIPNNLPKSLLKPLTDYSGAEYKELVGFIHDPDCKFTVVEGNRRLAACKLLLSDELRQSLVITSWAKPNKKSVKSLEKIPTIVYPTRAEVVPYLGVRHIAGIQKWDSYAKARYIASLVEDGDDIKVIEQRIGEKRGAVRKNYIAYMMLQQVEEEFDLDTTNAKNNFSLLMLAIGQRKIKAYLGLPKKLVETDLIAPISKTKIEQLRNIIVWIFGNKKEGTSAVIQESRHITSYLSYVVDSDEAVEHLSTNGNLRDAYDLSAGEEAMLIKVMRRATSSLKTANGIAYKYKDSEQVMDYSNDCLKAAKHLHKTLNERND